MEWNLLRGGALVLSCDRSEFVQSMCPTASPDNRTCNTISVSINPNRYPIVITYRVWPILPQLAQLKVRRTGQTISLWSKSWWDMYWMDCSLLGTRKVLASKKYILITDDLFSLPILLAELAMLQSSYAPCLGWQRRCRWRRQDVLLIGSNVGELIPELCQCANRLWINGYWEERFVGRRVTQLLLYGLPSRIACGYIVLRIVQSVAGWQPECWSAYCAGGGRRRRLLWQRGGQWLGAQSLGQVLEETALALHFSNKNWGRMRRSQNYWKRVSAINY